MDIQELRKEAHDVEVTVWVGKSGLDPVVEELADQLSDRNLVKVKFLRAARGEASTAELADDLADRIDATVIDVRGHTAVFH